MTLVPVDTSSEVSVISMLEQCRTWLTQAVEASPMEIALVKAQIATAAEATKQLNMSREIQLDAQELVRRSEYKLGKAVRQGQADGTIRGRGQKAETYDRWSGVNRETSTSIQTSPKDYIPHTEEAHALYTIVDSVDDEEFEQVIGQAKAEGNMSRANVVRKVKQQAQPSTRDGRADVIADLAEQGYSSHQMSERVGVRADRVREIARAYEIDIPADKTIGRMKRMDHTAAVDSAVTELENWAGSLTFIDFAEVDPSEAAEWLSSLTKSSSELRRFIKQIKENSHV